MKKVVLLNFISLMVLQLAAQTKTVNIRGNIKDTSVKTIEISHVVDTKLSKWENTKLDVVDGAFNTSIQIPFPIEMNIEYPNKLFRKNYIYNDAEILIDSVGTPHIIGSITQDEYEKQFLPFFHLNDELYDSLKSFRNRNHERYGNDIPKAVEDSANRIREKYCYQRAALLKEYIKQHPDSYVALWDIYYFVSIPPSHQYFDFEKLFSFFSNRMQKQSFINVLKQKLTESRKMQAGQVFPKDFFKGSEQLQSKIQSNNQYYLIDFWYSHCQPCAAQFPKLKKIYEQFHRKGFDIVSISVDLQKDKKDYLAAIQKNKIAWSHIWDKDGIAAKKFNINAFPTYILLDNNGKIINSDIQTDQLETFLKENL